MIFIHGLLLIKMLQEQQYYNFKPIKITNYTFFNFEFTQNKNDGF